jgi:hypothetical protein
MITIAPTFEGMPGIPLPYLPRYDWMVTSVMFICLIVVLFIFSRSKKHLYQSVRGFIQNRKRNSMFDEVTAADARHNFILIIHTIVMLGFSAYYYYSYISPSIFNECSHLLLLGGFILLFGLFILFKWMMYSFINWVFFQKVRNELWIKAFFHLFIWIGILLLPTLLVTTYFDISPQISLYLIASILFLAKILLFWKCFCNFFEKIYGSFHLILYFCALEILPDLILWKGMELISNNLIFKL